MRLSKLAIAAAFCVVAVHARAAGVQLIEVPADAAGPAIRGVVWYPCATPPAELRLSATLVIAAAKDCPVEGAASPLVVISHGRRGSFGGHHDTAEVLADAGFVVAAINHPGDTAQDFARTDDLSVLVERPADIRRLIDFMLGAWPDAARIDRQRIGLFGFSRGGYTGLVAIGGNPDFRKGLALCPAGPSIPMCEQIRRNDIPAEPLAHDPRIRAAVLADPAFALLFAADRVRDVKVPVRLWGSALGGDGVSPEAVTAIAGWLPARPDHQVANAGHFAFLAPCSPAATQAVPQLCTDPPGFDRVAFHKAFNADALAFFRQALGMAATP